MVREQNASTERTIPTNNHSFLRGLAMQTQRSRIAAMLLLVVLAAAPLAALTSDSAITGSASAALEDAAGTKIAAILQYLNETEGLSALPEAQHPGVVEEVQVIPLSKADSSAADATGDRHTTYLLFDELRQIPYFLQVSADDAGRPTLRFWSVGESEIVIDSELNAQLVPFPSGETFRLPRELAGMDKLSPTDIIACIARSLGISLSSTNLASRLSSVACSGTSVISLVLTVCNCFSIPSVGPAVVFGTIGCVNGWAKIISCGIASCTAIPQPPTGVSASDGTYSDRVRVSWYTASGATNYLVYRSDSSSGGQIYIGSTTTTTFNYYGATPGRRYYFWVRASNSAGTSGYSSPNSGYRP